MPGRRLRNRLELTRVELKEDPATGVVPQAAGCGERLASGAKELPPQRESRAHFSCIPGPRNDRSTLMQSFRTFLSYVKPYRRQVVFIFIATICFTGLNLVPPLLIRFLANRVIVPGNWHLLPWMAGAIAMVPITSAGIRFANAWLIMYTGRRMMMDLRMAVYRRALELDMQYHTDHSGGAVVVRMMDDVNRLQRLMTDDTVRMAIDSIVFFFSVSFVFWVSPWLGGILLGFILLYVLVYKFFSRRIRLATRAFREVYDRVAGRLSETIEGVHQVRIYNTEERETALFLDRTAESLDRQLASRMASVSLGTVCQGIAGYGSTVIVALTAYFVIRGAATLGDVLAVNSYIWMAIGPAIHLTQILGELTETSVSLDRIAEVLNTRPAIRSRPGAPKIYARRGEVEFRNVRFSYTPDVPLYRDLSLRIPAGKTVALVGPTGCGKTTFTSLLMRYWDVQSGAILIDGVDIRTVDLRSLRKLFGVVLQDPVIFEGTLAENIAYGKPDASREQIVRAARAAEIYEMALALPNGFDTVLGTGGVQLSVGERQRVSIARAILKDPLILIMDEATSSLDSRSEALIQKALARVLANRTSIVIAHRLSTITRADLIVVMDNGAIVEMGRHEELMAIRGGFYRKLYEALAGGQGGISR